MAKIKLNFGETRKFEYYFLQRMMSMVSRSMIFQYKICTMHIEHVLSKYFVCVIQVFLDIR